MRQSFLRQWNGRGGRWMRGTLVGLVLLVVAFHVFSTTLVNSPNNPVRQKLADPINHAYFSPIFAQNWSLFAPNPVNTDRGMLVQARMNNGRVTGYADVTSPVIANQLHDPLPDRSARQITRGAGNFMNAISTARSQLAPLHQQVQVVPTDKQLAMLDPGARSQYLDERAALTDVARWQARQLWGPDIAAVRVKLVSYTYPRFSKRDQEAATDPGSVSQIELPWWNGTDNGQEGTR